MCHFKQWYAWNAIREHIGSQLVHDGMWRTIGTDIIYCYLAIDI